MCFHNLAEIHDLRISKIVTDRHKQINAYIRDEVAGKMQGAENLQHYCDVWHVAKISKCFKYESGYFFLQDFVFIWVQKFINLKVFGKVS